MSEEKAGLPILPFADIAAFEAWLAAQPASSPGLWVKFAKPSAGAASITKSADDSLGEVEPVVGESTSTDATSTFCVGCQSTPNPPRV